MKFWEVFFGLRPLFLYYSLRDGNRVSFIMSRSEGSHRWKNMMNRI